MKKLDEQNFYGRHEQNSDYFNYSIKNFKPKCNNVNKMIGTTVNDGNIGPCTVNSDSNLKHGLQEDLFLRRSLFTGPYRFYPSFYAQMPKTNTQHIQAKRTPFLYSTSVPVLPQEHAVPQFSFPWGGSTTRNYGRKNDFYNKRHLYSPNNTCFYSNDCNLSNHENRTNPNLYSQKRDW